MSKVRILSGREIRNVLPMAAAIDAMHEAFTALHEGRAQVPPRIHLDIPENKGTALFMPARLGDVMGVKTVTLFADNPAKDLPYIQGCYCLLDATTGTPLVFADARVLTAIRTGAASGLATRLLARPDARCAAIFGAGVQGRTQLEAVCAARSIDHAMVFDPFPAAAESFARDMSETLGITVTVAASPAEALAEADVVCAATVSESPVFPDDAIKPGTHINAVGSYKPHVQEIPEATVLRSRVVVDNREAVLSETGDLIIPIKNGTFRADDIYADLAELCTASRPGREDDRQITFFKSVGLAVQDLAACQAAWRLAEAGNTGQVVDI